MRKVLALDHLAPGVLARHRPAEYDALMLGSEFCARQLPSPAEAAALRRAYSGPLLLATPVLTQPGLEAALALVRACVRPGRLEVAANDLGLLEVLRARFAGKVKISCGRLLSHRVKIMPQAYGRDFLARYGISSFEIDDETVVGRLKVYGLPFSWHYPFRYATTTRFCPWESHWASDCAHSCRGRLEPLRSPRLAKTLWLRGGAYFIRGQRPRAWAARNVFTPPS
jgi:hypothetical protein